MINERAGEITEQGPEAAELPLHHEVGAERFGCGTPAGIPAGQGTHPISWPRVRPPRKHHCGLEGRQGVQRSPCCDSLRGCQLPREVLLGPAASNGVEILWDLPKIYMLIHSATAHPAGHLALVPIPSPPWGSCGRGTQGAPTLGTQR